MKKSGAVARRRRTAFAVPGVGSDMVMVAAGRNKGRIIALGGGNLEAQQAAVEIQRSLQVGYFRKYAANAGLAGTA